VPCATSVDHVVPNAVTPEDNTIAILLSHGLIAPQGSSAGTHMNAEVTILFTGEILKIINSLSRYIPNKFRKLGFIYEKTWLVLRLWHEVRWWGFNWSKNYQLMLG
jgi:hypothetical protein